MTTPRFRILGACCCGLFLVSSAMAVEVRVTVHNLSVADSVALSPFTLVAHDGTLDGFDAGSAASTAVEKIAELGDGSDLIGMAGIAQPTAVTGTLKAMEGAFGPGIFLPGGSGSLVLSLDPSENRYLSYGAMVVPSNDAFLGNDSPTAVELFDAAGNFVASDFMITGNQIWDAGTEVNQLEGAAFIDGQDATLGTSEDGVIQLADPATEFSPYVDSTTAALNTFSVEPSAATPIASVSFEVVPEPQAGLLMGLMSLMGLVSLRRRAW